MSPCDTFRGALAATLLGEPGADGLAVLGWHKHLLGCGDCRVLLEKEEALELLLTSLPEPQLPADLAARVLARLHERERGLDRLLGLDEVLVPEGLSARILRGLEGRGAGDELDRLLEPAGVVEVPPGLSGRVLAGLVAEREGLKGASAGSGRPWLPSAGQWRAAAAAALLVGGAFLVSTSQRGAGQGGGHPDDAVIAWLPALEYWEEVRQLDPLEAELALKFDHVDAALLEEGT